MATFKYKPLNQFPRDSSLGDQTIQALDWMVTQINQLVGAGNPPPGQGIQTFGSGIINPTTSQVDTGGSRTASVTTAISYTSTPTSVSFFWDGSNGSSPFMIYRDDGTTTGPIVKGSGMRISGLTASTNYFFYPYFDESLQLIQFATVANIAIGSPPAAFLAQNIQAVQQQILRGRIPLAGLFSTTGITTPATGTGGGSGGSGGGSGGGNGGRSIQ